MPFLHHPGFPLQWQSTMSSNQVDCASIAAAKMKSYLQHSIYRIHFPLYLTFFVCGKEEAATLKLKIICASTPKIAESCFYGNFTSHCLRHKLNMENLSPNTPTLQKTRALQNSQWEPKSFCACM